MQTESSTNIIMIVAWFYQTYMNKSLVELLMCFSLNIWCVFIHTLKIARFFFATQQVNIIAWLKYFINAFANRNAWVFLCSNKRRFNWTMFQIIVPYEIQICITARRHTTYQRQHVLFLSSRFFILSNRFHVHCAHGYGNFIGYKNSLLCSLSMQKDRQMKTSILHPNTLCSHTHTHYTYKRTENARTSALRC